MHGETIDLIDTKSLALFFLLDRSFFLPLSAMVAQMLA